MYWCVLYIIIIIVLKPKAGGEYECVCVRGCPGDAVCIESTSTPAPRVSIIVAIRGDPSYERCTCTGLELSCFTAPRNA